LAWLLCLHKKTLVMGAITTYTAIIRNGQATRKQITATPEATIRWCGAEETLLS
jgi:hypothetical protein